MIGQPPPFALDAPTFRFRAIALYAGRAALGGDREVALGCLVSCRLAAGLLEPFGATSTDLKSRATAARQWLASLSVPASFRAAAAAVIDASSEGDRATAAKGLANLVPQVSGKIDEAALTEIRDLVQELRETRDDRELAAPRHI